MANIVKKAKLTARTLKSKGGNMKFELVPKWQTGWKWFSNWAFMLIVFLATVPMPPEVIALLPPTIKKHLIAIVAICGLILRFVKQAPPKTFEVEKNG